jgi:hypothetical protein
MEIIVRMRRYMEEKKVKYKVAYIPDPLCWTKLLTDYKCYYKEIGGQGTIESIKKHKK